MRVVGLVGGSVVGGDIVYPLLGFAFGTIVSHIYLSYWVYSVLGVMQKNFFGFLSYLALIVSMSCITYLEVVSEFSVNTLPTFILYALFLCAYVYKFRGSISVLFTELKDT